MQETAVIVYGPPGCGKTQHSEKLCEKFNCNKIIDDWQPEQEITSGALHLTTKIVLPETYPTCLVLPFESIQL